MLYQTERSNGTQTLQPDKKAETVQLAAQRAEIGSVVYKGGVVVLSIESNESERPRCRARKTEERPFERSPAPSPPENEERRQWEGEQRRKEGLDVGG